MHSFPESFFAKPPKKMNRKPQNPSEIREDTLFKGHGNLTTTYSATVLYRCTVWRLQKQNVEVVKFLASADTQVNKSY